MPSTSDFRPGLVIKYNNELWTVVEFQHVNPGNWRAFVRTKLKNLKSGKVIENRFRAGEAIEIIRIERKEFQFLYRDGSGYVFMDKENYEQLTLPAEFIEGQAGYILPNTDVQINFYNGRAIGLEIPPSVVLTVVDTEPVIRNATATQQNGNDPTPTLS